MSLRPFWHSTVDMCVLQLRSWTVEKLLQYSVVEAFNETEIGIHM